MKRLPYWLGLSLTLAATIYYIHAVLRNGEFLLGLGWGWHLGLPLGRAVLLQCLVIFLGAVAWFLLLRGIQEPAKMARTLTLFGLTQLAKYLPGNFGQYASRAALAGNCGLQTHRVLFSMILETTWVLVAAAFVSLVALLTQGEALRTVLPQLPPLGKMLLLVAAAVTLPIFSVRIFNRWRSGAVGQRFGGASLSLPSRLVLLTSFSLYVLSFLIMACMVETLGRGIFGVENGQLGRLTGIVAVAWTAGYVVPGAPAGLGIREAVLVSALTPLWGGPAAVGTSIVLRLATTAGDGLVFFAALLERRRIFPGPGRLR